MDSSFLFLQAYQIIQLFANRMGQIRCTLKIKFGVHRIESKPIE